jgi:SagB-type dehydrogenase family enzyme
VSDPTDAEPRPRDECVDVARWSPRILESLRLGTNPVGDVAFRSVLDRRTSVRDVDAPSFDQLGAFLWHGARVRATAIGSRGRWERRAAPSAGGLHPIELFVLEYNATRLFRYDPLRHCLDSLADLDVGGLAKVHDGFATLAPESRGAFLIFLGNRALVDARYYNGDSLLARDAGALIATLHLVATALDLGFCALGLLGTRLGGAVSLPSELVPLGTALVGVPRPAIAP